MDQSSPRLHFESVDNCHVCFHTAAVSGNALLDAEQRAVNVEQGE
jgi:hypothetical protein